MWGILLAFLLAFPVLSWATDGGAPTEDEATLYWTFLDDSTEFLVQHFRWPNVDEADRLLAKARAKIIIAEASEAGLEGEDADEADDSELANLSVADVLQFSQDGVMRDFAKGFPQRYLKMRRKLATAYSRAIAQTDLPVPKRTPATTPSNRLYFLSTIMPESNGAPKLMLDFLQGNYTEDELKDLYIPGRAPQGPFPQPLIFARGEAELVDAARLKSQARFRSFVDKSIVTDARAQATLDALNKSKGFVAISWTSGKDEYSKDFFDSLIAMLEERDWILIVGPTQQNMEGMPDIFFKHPRIHVLTNTIENRYLKLSNVPINPNTENALAVLKRQGMYKPGQKVIGFAPHQMMETVATATNDILPVELWTTGSINEPLGAFTSPSSGGSREAAKKFHKMKALVVEKGDGVSIYDRDRLQNIWHVRPISFYDDREYDGTAGFIDRSRVYQARYSAEGQRQIEITDIDPEYIYLGDAHDRVTDPRFVESLVKDLGLSAATRVTFVTGDAFDGSTINHWVGDNMVAMNAKVQAKRTSALQEVNQLITTVNALLQRYPNARFAQIVGNHDEWLSKLLDRTPDIQQVLNGDFIDELCFAVKTLKISVWEYIFKRRQEVMGALLKQFPAKSREILSRVLPVHDPDRVDVIARGQNLFAGPAHRRNALMYHGDKGSGPKSAGFKSNARAMPEGGGVVGHTHRVQIFGEVMDVGAMVPPVQDYTLGQYAGQGQALAFVYPNGTKQLLIYSPIAGTMVQRYAELVSTGAEFTGSDPLTVVANDNDRVDKAKGETWVIDKLDELRSTMGICEKRLSVGGEP